MYVTIEQTKEDGEQNETGIYFMDLDGTISDPKEGITKAVAHALSYYGIQVENLDTLEKFIGPPLLDSFQDFYGFSEEQSREAVGKYRECFSRQGLLRMFCMME